MPDFRNVANGQAEQQAIRAAERGGLSSILILTETDAT